MTTNLTRTTSRLPTRTINRGAHCNGCHWVVCILLCLISATKVAGFTCFGFWSIISHHPSFDYLDISRMPKTSKILGQRLGSPLPWPKPAHALHFYSVVVSVFSSLVDCRRDCGAFCDGVVRTFRQLENILITNQYTRNSNSRCTLEHQTFLPPDTPFVSSIASTTININIILRSIYQDTNNLRLKSDLLPKKSGCPSGCWPFTAFRFYWHLLVSQTLVDIQL